MAATPPTSIESMFKHKLTGREFLGHNKDGKLCAGSAGEKSLDLPTGAVNVKIERSGGTTNVSAPGLEFTLRKLEIGPDRSTYWRYELIVPGSMHCYIDEREAEWLLNWALPRKTFELFVNLPRPEGVPPGPSNQYWLRDDAKGPRRGEVSSKVYESYVVYDGKIRDNPAAAATGNEIEKAYYYPVEQIVVYTRIQCCGEYPCKCADVCKNTVRIVRLTGTGQEILLDWVAYDTKANGFLV